MGESSMLHDRHNGRERRAPQQPSAPGQAGGLRSVRGVAVPIPTQTLPRHKNRRVHTPAGLIQVVALRLLAAGRVDAPQNHASALACGRGQHDQARTMACFFHPRRAPGTAAARASKQARACCMARASTVARAPAPHKAAVWTARAARTLHVHGPHAVLDGVGGVRPLLHHSHAAARQRHAERPVGVPAASARRGWEVGGWVGGCCTSQCGQPQIAALQRRPHTAVRPDPALPKLHSAHSAQQAPTHP